MRKLLVKKQSVNRFYRIKINHPQSREISRSKRSALPPILPTLYTPRSKFQSISNQIRTYSFSAPKNASEWSKFKWYIGLFMFLLLAYKLYKDGYSPDFEESKFKVGPLTFPLKKRKVLQVYVSDKPDKHYCTRPELKEIQSFFESNLSNRRVSKKTDIFYLKGDGGFGKSQLAKKFAGVSKKHGHYSVIYWISCENEASINNAFRNLADKLQIDTSNREPKQILQLIHEKLENTAPDDRWLLIFDNMDSKQVAEIINQCIPNHKVSALITGRYDAEFLRKKKHYKKLDLKRLDYNESKALFEKMLKKRAVQWHPSESSLKEIINILGATPLGLSLAVDMIDRLKRSGTDEQAILDNLRSPLGRRTVFASCKPDSYQYPIVKMWDYHIEQVKKDAEDRDKNDGGHRSKIIDIILNLLSFYDVNEISTLLMNSKAVSKLELIQGLYESDVSAVSLLLHVEDAFDLIGKYSLFTSIASDKDRRMLESLHPILRYAIIEKSKDHISKGNYKKISHFVTSGFQLIALALSKQKIDENMLLEVLPPLVGIQRSIESVKLSDQDNKYAKDYIIALDAYFTQSIKISSLNKFDGALLEQFFKVRAKILNGDLDKNNKALFLYLRGNKFQARSMLKDCVALVDEEVQQYPYTYKSDIPVVVGYALIPISVIGSFSLGPLALLGLAPSFLSLFVGGRYQLSEKEQRILVLRSLVIINSNLAIMYADEGDMKIAKVFFKNANTYLSTLNSYTIEHLKWHHNRSIKRGETIVPTTTTDLESLLEYNGALLNNSTIQDQYLDVNMLDIDKNEEYKVKFITFNS